MEAEHVAELKKLFDRDYRDIILDLRDPEAGGSRRSEVSKALRGGWHDA
jgi:hypothetical protein